MSKTVVLIWLGAQSARAALEPDLDAWAAARWLRLEAPAGEARAAAGHDDALVARIEELLDQARVAAGSLDDARASERLDEIEQLLRRHPELPQAPWLMAERLHVEALLAARRPQGEAAALELETRAAALEGPRAAPFGRTGPGPSAAGTAVKARARGLGAQDRLFWDGERTAARFETAPGEHHALVVRRQRVAWAGWVQVSRGSSEIVLPVPKPSACSADDLAGVTVRADRVMAPSGVGCEAWAVALPSERGGVQVATCRGSSCGPLVHWRRDFGAVYRGPPQPPGEPGWPTWATIAIAGAGALAVTGVVLWQTGTFDQPERGRTTWKFYGPSGAAARF